MKKRIIKGAGGWSGKKVPGMYRNGGQLRKAQNGNGGVWTTEITDKMREEQALMDSIMTKRYGTPNWQKKWQQEQLTMDFDSLLQSNPDFFKLILANISNQGSTSGGFNDK